MTEVRREPGDWRLWEQELADTRWREEEQDEWAPSAPSTMYVALGMLTFGLLTATGLALCVWGGWSLVDMVRRAVA